MYLSIYLFLKYLYLYLKNESMVVTWDENFILHYLFARHNLRNARIRRGFLGLFEFDRSSRGHRRRGGFARARIMRSLGLIGRQLIRVWCRSSHGLRRRDSRAGQWVVRCGGGMRERRGGGERWKRSVMCRVGRVLVREGHVVFCGKWRNAGKISVSINWLLRKCHVF